MPAVPGRLTGKVAVVSGGGIASFAISPFVACCLEDCFCLHKLSLCDVDLKATGLGLVYVTGLHWKEHQFGCWILMQKLQAKQLPALLHKD